MGAQSKNEGSLMGILLLFFPSIIATLIAGGVTYFGLAPEIPGFWGIAGAALIGIATGYGARWGSSIYFGAEFFVSVLIGVISGRSLSKAYSNHRSKSENKLEGMVLLSVIGMLIGYIGGGLIAYNVTKQQIYEWALINYQEQPENYVEHYFFHH